MTLATFNGSPDFNGFNKFDDINSKKLQGAKKGTLTTLQINDLTAKLKECSGVIDSWDKFPPESKEKLKNVAYEALKIDEKQEKQNFFQYLIGRFSLILLIFKGQGKALAEALEAWDILIDNILDKVENDSPIFQENVLEALDSVKNQVSCLNREKVSGDSRL